LPERQRFNHNDLIVVYRSRQLLASTVCCDIMLLAIGRSGSLGYGLHGHDHYSDRCVNMIILAIGTGLLISGFKLLQEAYDAPILRRRKAATTVQKRFRDHLWNKRNFTSRYERFMSLRRWRERPDPTSVMGRTTAWDSDTVYSYPGIIRVRNYY